MKNSINDITKEVITNEKPISLHPLKFDEALKALLKAPPKDKKKENKKLAK
jgi:hypothetical protein